MLLCLNPTYVKGLGYNVDCGRCRACRLKKTNEWAMRIRDHASTFQHKAIMVLLTYDRKHVPTNYSLNPVDLQYFWKRLRYNLKKAGINEKISYYACGEYGGERHRPHYHAIIIGLLATPQVKEIVYRSWGKCSNFEDAFGCENVRGIKGYAYCAGYCYKKTKPRYNKEFIKKTRRVPEFMRCSQGLGLSYILKYMAHRPFEVTRFENGKEVLLCRYYRKKLGIKLSHLEDYINEKQEQFVQHILRRCPEARVIGKGVGNNRCYSGHIVNDAFIKEYRKQASVCDDMLKAKQERFATRKGAYR